MIEGVKAGLARIERRAARRTCSLEVIRDQCNYIYEALHEINVHLVGGQLLASLVVLVFMRNWRSTLIAGVAIPASVVSTFGMMWALHFTLNSVTMLALVLMVGVVIDDAIVVLENIFRFVEEKKMPPMQAAREATREIGLAVLATTLSLVVIFIPVSFMSSISGRFLYQFGITAAVAVMVSLLVSFTLTPMMSARMLKAKKTRRGDARCRALAPRFLSPDRRRLHAACSAGRCGSAGSWRSAAHRGHVDGRSALHAGEAGVHAQRRGRGRVRGQRHRAAKAPASQSMDEACARSKRRSCAVPRRATACSSGGRRLPRVGATSAQAYVRIAPHEERTLSVTRLWHAIAQGQAVAALSQGNYSQRDVMTDIRRAPGASISDLRAAVRNYSALQHRRRQRWTSTSSSAARTWSR